VARASGLASRVGAGRAGVVAALSHGAFLIAIALSSVIAWLAVSAGDTDDPVFLGLLAWNALFTAVLGGVLLSSSRWARGAAWAARRMGLFRERSADVERAFAEAPRVPLLAFAAYGTGRVVHLGQSFALLAAVGAEPTTLRALVSEAVKLVSGNVGDMVPGQAGVLEGAYRAFAPSLGLGDLVAVAVALAIVLRVARLVVAGAAGVLAAVLPPEGGSTERTWSSVGTATLVLVASLSFAHGAEAQAGENDPARVIVRQRAVGIANPVGLEHAVALALNAPLGDAHNPLTSLAHLEVGVSQYTSPVYARSGGYLQLSPLSLLVLRAELTGTVMWPLGDDGYRAAIDYGGKAPRRSSMRARTSAGGASSSRLSSSSRSTSAPCGRSCGARCSPSARSSARHRSTTRRVTGSCSRARTG
jgi:hypothetical protein